MTLAEIKKAANEEEARFCQENSDRSLFSPDGLDEHMMEFISDLFGLSSIPPEKKNALWQYCGRIPWEESDRAGCADYIYGMIAEEYQIYLDLLRKLFGTNFLFEIIE